MGFMVVAVTNDGENLYIYHGKDKKGEPIFYGFENNKNTKVYPRLYKDFSQAVDIANNIAIRLCKSNFKNLETGVWSEDSVKFYLETKYK